MGGYAMAGYAIALLYTVWLRAYLSLHQPSPHILAPSLHFPALYGWLLHTMILLYKLWLPTYTSLHAMAGYATASNADTESSLVFNQCMQGREAGTSNGIINHDRDC